MKIHDRVGSMRLLSLKNPPNHERLMDSYGDNFISKGSPSPFLSPFSGAVVVTLIKATMALSVSHAHEKRGA
jgi:hypothetical protein